MNLKQINNLTELFFDQFNKQINKDKILLSTLGDKKKKLFLAGNTRFYLFSL